MAIPHAQSGEVVSVHPLGAVLADHGTHTLVKTDNMEIIRLVLARDKEIATHTALTPRP
jgi:hypothetical protein